MSWSVELLSTHHSTCYIISPPTPHNVRRGFKAEEGALGRTENVESADTCL